MKISNGLLRQVCNVVPLLLCASIAGAALAQSYPNKPIRIIVPYPPGGATDLIGRTIGLKLAEAWTRPVIVDNRGGAEGNIGIGLVAQAVPDGYTLVVVPANLAINPSFHRKLSYDPVKDFAPITQVTSQAYLFVVHPSVPAKTVKEFIAFAKSKKDGITYTSSGSGLPPHLGWELLKRLAGFDALHVPYKGTAPSMIALIAGEADASMVTPPSSLSHVRTGRLRALAVTSLKRSVLLPDVPTVAESGFPGFEVSGWIGLLAPAGTPREVVAKLHNEISRILKLPDVRDRMVADGVDPVGGTPEEFEAYIKAEIIKWAKVIKQSGARAD
ncbi:MAG: tripartite tricarboxylate transporter substrate binding protein [Betaproteobacteria bacterium]|nr:tripartite tricarboxylate transporter substrate binding protein [Betaproteobacteria bacterium]